MGDNQTTSTQTSASASPTVRATVDKLAQGVGDAYAPGKSLYQAPSAATSGAISGLLDASKNPAYASGVGGALDLTSDVAAGNRFGMDDPGYAMVRQNAINDTIESTNAPFLSSGTFGSDKHKENIGRGVSSTIAGLDYGNYQNDITRQERAQANLPGLLNAGALPSQMQLTGGGLLDADTAAKAAGPTDYLGKLSGILAGNAGTAGTTTTQTQPGTPWWQTAAALGIGLL